MTYEYSQKNTKWQRDNTGHYVEFEQNTEMTEVSLNFENILGTSEVIDSVATTTDLAVNTSFAYYLAGRVGNYELAIIQFTDLDTRGIFPVAVTVTTNQNRTYKKHFRVKVV
jgi:hypothetical protein